MLTLLLPRRGKAFLAFLVLALGPLSVGAQSGPGITEASSREVSALFTPGPAESDDGSPVIAEVPSREVSLLVRNGPGVSDDGSPVIIEAVTREMSLLVANGPAESDDGSPVFVEVSSREFSLLVENGPTEPFAEVISRELSVISTLAPVVRLDLGSARYLENQPPQSVSPGTTLLDVEGDFVGGTLTARIAAQAEDTDRLRLAAMGDVEINATEVLVDGVRIGTVNAANAVVTGSDVLSVAFLASADNARVQALLRALAFDSASENPSPLARTVAIEVTDAAARSIGAVERSLEVVPVNDAPVAGADTLERRPNASGKLRVEDLLRNDSDVESPSPSLTVVSVDPISANGILLSVVEGWIRFPALADATPDWFSYTVQDPDGATAVGRVDIRVRSPDDPARNLISIRVENGDVHLVFQGIPERRYAIQYTTSLVSPAWAILGQREADASGRLEFVDPAPSDPVRYYRTVQP